MAAGIPILGDMNTMVVIAVFILFIVIAYKVFKFLTKAVILAVIGAIFPLFMGYMGYPAFMGFKMGLDLYSMFIFAIAAIILFAVYTVVAGLLGVGKLITSPFRKKGPNKSDVKKMVHKEMEKEKK